MILVSKHTFMRSASMIKYKSKFHESQLKVIVDYKVAKYIVKLLDQVLS